MKRLFLTTLAIAVLALGVSAPALARHRHHSSVGFYFGDPFFWGGGPFYRPYYRPLPPYYYYEPPTVIIEREPPVYIQRQPAVPTAPAAPAAPAAQASNLWYYCPNPAGYYPYVPSCNQQWVPVNPNSVPPAPGMR